LWSNTNKFTTHLRQLGFNTGLTETPIIPIMIGNTFQTFLFWQELSAQGVYTNPIISPAVSEGSELIRTSLMATHTEEQLHNVLEIFELVGNKLEMIQTMNENVLMKS